MGELREFILDTKMQNIGNFDQRQQQNQIHRKQRNQQYRQQRHQDPQLIKYEEEQLHFNTLEMTLRSGLAALETLIELTELSVWGLNHFIRDPEIDWMVEHRPELRDLDRLSSTLKQYYFNHRRQQ
ncbi:hypothetical protein BGX30_000644 [Mortierella sp. GBA39]|nr:hypothetical protein BGX30_000644 [Mortierella sp. GBA39]